jgi:UDP-glucose 4-epimerase
MKALVTGAAGFIGSSLVDRLLTAGHQVIGIDNFSTGNRRFLSEAQRSRRFRLVRADITRRPALEAVLDHTVDWVFHLAANADVRHGLEHPERDLRQNTEVTFNVLEAMRKKRVRRIVFSSTGSVYGEAKQIPTPEDCAFPAQTSLYGASKLAAEGLISAYAEGFGFQGLVFRFVSILGERYTHGHVFDFVRRLRRNPRELPILGNGKQRKSYLYVQDCIDAMLHAVERPATAPFNVYNLGTAEYVTVNQSVDVICEELGVRPRRRYSGGDRGWVGDNPFIFLDCAKIRRTGWRPKVSIRDGVRRTVAYLSSNPWLFKERA